jgi:hypothetical protein
LVYGNALYPNQLDLLYLHLRGERDSESEKNNKIHNTELGNFIILGVLINSTFQYHY